MKAIILTKYASPDVLKLEEIDKPIVPPNGVVVRVHAACVNINVTFEQAAAVPMVAVTALQAPQN